MYLDNLLVMLKNPDDTWLERLRRGHFVWMAKENKFAKVEWACQLPTTLKGRGLYHSLKRIH